MKKSYIVIFFLMFFFMSCTDKFNDFNTDKKSPSDVSGETLFGNSMKELADQVSNTNVNLNVWKLFAQYWTETTYTNESNYDIVNRTIADNAFDTYYRLILKGFIDAADKIAENEVNSVETQVIIDNKLAIIEIATCYAYYNLVTIFGDIPYTQALDIENISPAYDDAKTITLDLISRIDAAYAKLTMEDVPSTVDNGSFYNGADVLFDGDIVSWQKFAQSLKLKIAIGIADSDDAIAKTNVEAAVTAGVFTSAADNALFSYEGSAPNTNKLHADLVLSGRKDFVPANTIIDLMSTLKDPRLDAYFDDRIAFDYQKKDGTRLADTLFTSVPVYFYYADGTKELKDPVIVKVVKDTIDVHGIFMAQADTILEPSYYLGGDYGYSNNYGSVSHIDDRIEAATYPGILMTYDEILFYMAEAAERGYNVGMTAEEAYNAAIAQSFATWEMSDSLSSYMSNPDVAYSSAPGDWRQKIGTQAYIGYYVRGYVGYTTYRRLDYPKMNVAPSAETEGPVPTRFTYPVNEQTLNADNYEAAATKIGGDDLLTPLFWDVNQPK
jgi:hypothetical protein